MTTLFREHEIALGGMPFAPEHRELVFVDNGSHSGLFNFLEWNIEKVKDIFQQNGLEFTYIPDLVGGLSYKDIKDQVRYVAPWADVHEVLRSVDSAIAPADGTLFSSVSCLDGQPALVAAGEGTCHAYMVDVTKPELFLLQFQQIAEAHSMKVRAAEKSGQVPAGHEDNDPGIEFAPEIVRRKRPCRIVRMLIENAVAGTAAVSRMVIEENGDVILPDYHSMKINLRPLQKAVYLLYLNHPEGIALKDMMAHEKELQGIISQLTGNDDMYGALKSEFHMAESMNCSLDSYCSRMVTGIKQAFEDSFDQKFAKDYIIGGEKGEALSIGLSRGMVKCKCCI